MKSALFGAPLAVIFSLTGSACAGSSSSAPPPVIASGAEPAGPPPTDETDAPAFPGPDEDTSEAQDDAGEPEADVRGDWLGRAIANLRPEEAPEPGEEAGPTDPLADAFAECEDPEGGDCECPTGVGYDPGRHVWVRFGCDGFDWRNMEGTLRAFVEHVDATRSRRVYARAVTTRAVPAIRSALAQRLRGVVYPPNGIARASWDDRWEEHREVIALSGALDGLLLWFETDLGRTELLHLTRVDRSVDRVVAGAPTDEEPCDGDSEACRANAIRTVLIAPDASSIWVAGDAVFDGSGEWSDTSFAHVVAVPTDLRPRP